MPTKVKVFSIEPRIRIHLGKGWFVGPGKAGLLEHIDRTGSIGEAARAMGMSYMRAWTMVKSLEGCFVEPLVNKSRGGNARGGAKLSMTGHLVVSLYREMEAASQTATHDVSERFRKLVKT